VLELDDPSLETSDPHVREPAEQQPSESEREHAQPDAGPEDFHAWRTVPTLRGARQLAERRCAARVP